MKKLFILLLSVLALQSCKKDDIVPNEISKLPITPANLKGTFNFVSGKCISHSYSASDPVGITYIDDFSNAGFPPIRVTYRKFWDVNNGIAIENEHSVLVLWESDPKRDGSWEQEIPELIYNPVWENPQWFGNMIDPNLPRIIVGDSYYINTPFGTNPSTETKCELRGKDLTLIINVPESSDEYGNIFKVTYTLKLIKQ
jgi:hypothetical protein